MYRDVQFPLYDNFTLKAFAHAAAAHGVAASTAPLAADLAAAMAEARRAAARVWQALPRDGRGGAGAVHGAPRAPPLLPLVHHQARGGAPGRPLRLRCALS